MIFETLVQGEAFHGDGFFVPMCALKIVQARAEVEGGKVLAVADVAVDVVEVVVFEAVAVIFAAVVVGVEVAVAMVEKVVVVVVMVVMVVMEWKAI